MLLSEQTILPLVVTVLVFTLLLLKIEFYDDRLSQKDFRYTLLDPPLTITFSVIPYTKI